MLLYKLAKRVFFELTANMELCGGVCGVKRFEIPCHFSNHVGLKCDGARFRGPDGTKMGCHEGRQGICHSIPRLFFPDSRGYTFLLHNRIPFVPLNVSWLIGGWKITSR